ncbi:murein hydrolase activator EnvC family protein [Paenibacillus koleovorans]|uniref:murein hydrolase activator EnvC family protein n=1 Tax=Paenibacillus koleovorans TaxID=121608 RepID=UPI000FD8C6E9|nr:peptidoglycan DD-metalloendopeptidase family protein [Paenibacillus koleovorans]
MKRTTLSLILAAGIALLVTVPNTGYALTDAEINAQIKANEKRAADAAKQQQDAEKQKKDIANQKVQETKNMQELLTQIEAQNDQMTALNTQKEQVIGELKETNKQLTEAEERVVARDNLMKSRLRLMYTNGFVSYIEVLLDSTSFSDFLDRYQALKSIVGQDKEILESNKRDRQVVADKKVQVETQLAQVQDLATQAEVMKNTLVAKEKEKEVLIASLSSKEKSFEEISESQLAAVNKLAQENAALYRKLEENKAKLTYSGGKLNWPLPGRTTLSSGFGYRIDPINKADANHTGFDIPAPAGTAIQAAEEGIVIIARYTNGYGNTVVIDHGGNLQTWYGHIRNGGIVVEEGDSVKRGQKIAEVGSTGRSTGNHLHFEVRLNNNPVNPGPYVGR